MTEQEAHDFIQKILDIALNAETIEEAIGLIEEENKKENKKWN